VTAENGRENITEELQRARTAFAASAHLFSGGFVADAVSRLSYALLYNVRALLLTKGLEPKSHEGALRLLSQHFVKEGRLDPGVAHLFSRMMKYREEADYNVFTGDDYATLRAECEKCAGEMVQLIKAAGYPPIAP
jgi:uncharacterized protein (UPF0332 family)